MKQLILILVFVLPFSAQSQEWLRKKNTISIYGGVSTEGLGLKYARTFNQHENKFAEFEIGGGRGLMLVVADGTAGVSFNRGKKRDYFNWGLHFAYMRIDFFDITDIYTGNLSIGYHYRSNKLDFKFRGLLGISSFERETFPLPGVSISIGPSF